MAGIGADAHAERLLATVVRQFPETVGFPVVVHQAVMQLQVFRMPGHAVAFEVAGLAQIR